MCLVVDRLQYKADCQLAFYFPSKQTSLHRLGAIRRYRMRTLAVLSLMFFIATMSARAEVISIMPAELKEIPANNEVNIFFNGNTSNRQIYDLGSAIDTVNVNYPSVEWINLYINSTGGDSDAARVGYWIIKNSKIPVRTINISYVASSATMLYCAGRDRQALAGSYFLMHPVALKFNESYYNPDAVLRNYNILNSMNDILKDIYKDCTTLGDEDLDNLVKGDHFTKYIDSEEALRIGLSSLTTQSVRPKLGSIYIVSNSDI